ncbi:3-beta hydroxysteroid dehydrogenase/isomerase family-domain-containing protein [Rhodocollybia butyracea]|uniref:3-beta hydroxysteroid dehydrogenase/isomerase family-domain-containing protein n=1 Tax=Rhodocollybia butyracea TaxID=206335 RepID=A0A9P5PA25_9AGAR|nr:3-beta hydroxysteroid dehydrogenase/isomerase family-domain-containing protein [Rhodocollybia butyracea]
MPFSVVYPLVASAASALLLTVYCRLNGKSLARIPRRVLDLSPVRWDAKDFEAVKNKLDDYPVDIQQYLPPKTGRRYIVVGGSGFLGGWIIIHLLKRGELPSNIRIIDLHPPSRYDFASGPAKEVQFIQTDIASAEQVEAAFKAPWPLSTSSNSEITVFHCAAIIRFYERHPSLLPLSEINFIGTEHVLKASFAAGGSILVFTSSGSVAQRRTRLLLIPWVEKEPENFVQVLGDQEPSELPKSVDGFCCCYAHTKLRSESLIRASDNSPSGPSGETTLRTGCIRPANAIYGPGADLYEYFLAQGKNNVSFFQNMMTANVYVENCSLAHLCYEQRLIELSSNESRHPDIGGQVFTVTDPSPPILFSDIYAALTHFSDGAYGYHVLPPTPILLISYLVEQYYLTRHALCTSRSSILLYLGKILPPLRGDLLALQPATVSLSHAHLIADDSRARLAPMQGGLGYVAPWNALEGLYKSTQYYLEQGSLRPASARKGFGHGK